MLSLKSQILLTISLGFLSLLAVVANHLALVDIHHAETDVSLEWSVVRIGMLVLLFFTISTLFTLFRAMRMVKQNEPAKSVAG